MRCTSILLAATALCACEKSAAETTQPDDAVSVQTKPTAESLESCVDRIATWIEIPDKPPEERDPDWQSINKECGELYAKCGGVETTVAFVRGGNRGLVLRLADDCTKAYCDGFAAPKPKMCDAANDIMTGKDTGATQVAALEFHKAMLAADMGADSSLDSVAERLADLWTGYGVVDMGGLGDAATLGFVVKINDDGFVLETSAPQKWGTGDEAPTTKIGLKPTKEKNKEAAPDVSRWDFAALAAEAKALKRANPEASRVSIVLGEDVPAGVQAEAMKTLRGEGCELQADDSPVEVPQACLFWRQSLQ